MQTNHTLAKPCQVSAKRGSHKQVRNLRTTRLFMPVLEMSFGMVGALPPIMPNAFLPATECRRLAYRVHCQLSCQGPFPLALDGPGVALSRFMPYSRGGMVEISAQGGNFNPAVIPVRL